MKYLIPLMLLILIGCGISDEPDFYTNHGLSVTVGAKNNPGPRTIELWTDQTIIFWRYHYPHWLQCINDNIESSHAYFVDEEFVMHNGKKYYGLAHSRDLSMEIACCGEYKVRGTFIHELSHIFLGQCVGIWNNNGSHAIFEETKLDTY